MFHSDAIPVTIGIPNIFLFILSYLNLIKMNGDQEYRYRSTGRWVKCHPASRLGGRTIKDKSTTTLTLYRYVYILIRVYNLHVILYV